MYSYLTPLESILNPLDFKPRLTRFRKSNSTPKNLECDVIYHHNTSAPNLHRKKFPRQPLQLSELDLSHCKLGDEGALAVAAYLQQVHRVGAGQLRLVRLANNGVAAQGMAGLVRGLLPEGDGDDVASSSVKHLDLRLNPLGDAGAEHLAARECHEICL